MVELVLHMDAYFYRYNLPIFHQPVWQEFNIGGYEYAILSIW